MRRRIKHQRKSSTHTGSCVKGAELMTRQLLLTRKGILMADNYETHGDFGSYNEPSWVPEGYCKCCSTIKDEMGHEQRKPPDRLTRMVAIDTKTEKKDLVVYQCSRCDTATLNR